MTVKVADDETVMDVLVRCELVEAVDKLDSLVLTLRIPHQAEDTLSGKIVVGAAYEVTLDDDGTTVTYKGDIVEVRHSRRGGRHRVTAIGLDALHRLRTANAAAQVWEVAHDAIVGEIASRNSLSGAAEGVDGTAALLLQNAGSDGAFLDQLARENNYYVRVVDGDLQFKRFQSAGAAVELDFDEDLSMEIEQTTSLDGLVTGVTVYGSDYIQDEAFTGTATTSDLQGISGGDTGPGILQTLAGDRELIINQSGYSDVSRATARAKAELQSRAERFLQGSVWTSGRPDAASGKAVTVSGAGWPLDGTFFIRQTAHVLDVSGYRTRIDFMSDSLPERS